MLALSSVSDPLFSNNINGWPLDEPRSHDHNYYAYNYKAIHQQVDQLESERSTPTAISGGDTHMAVKKKLNHNASERDRRKKVMAEINLYIGLVPGMFSAIPGAVADMRGLKMSHTVDELAVIQKAKRRKATHRRTENGEDVQGSTPPPPPAPTKEPINFSLEESSPRVEVEERVPVTPVARRLLGDLAKPFLHIIDQLAYRVARELCFRCREEQPGVASYVAMKAQSDIAAQLQSREEEVQHVSKEMEAAKKDLKHATTSREAEIEEAVSEAIAKYKELDELLKIIFYEGENLYYDGFSKCLNMVTEIDLNFPVDKLIYDDGDEGSPTEAGQVKNDRAPVE
ncbi:transcription factor ORG2-like [Quillaja saponaria]|uniref:Transcription factor ORG2-like n=1 Tax=Quillaja saponaria TaxID=32244 RepID=A0AAD7VDS9_QUISA|nr:transcription factor ORG2-like [Quillaja saponaria]